MAPLNNSLPARVHEFISAAILIAALIGLYFTSRINYLLFHSLAEIFSIVVACSLFMIAWNSRQYIKNPYLLFIGIAYLFIGGLDLLHTLTYKGMPIFTDYDFYANQLWIGARYMESITLLLAFAYLYAGKPIRPYGVLIAYTLATGLLIASVLYWKIFPECFAAGTGLTPFKKISEYIICLILIINIFLLTKSRQKFEPKVFHLLLWSIVCTIISEGGFCRFARFAKRSAMTMVSGKMWTPISINIPKRMSAMGFVRIALKNIILNSTYPTENFSPKYPNQ